MASELRVTTIANNAGSESVDTTYVVNGSAKVWCNFQQSTSHTVRDSLNISSLTDDGFGLTDISYTSSFDNTNYAAAGSGGRQAAASQTAYWCFPTRSTELYSTSSTALTSGYSSGTSSYLTPHDCYLNVVSINGDLA